MSIKTIRKATKNSDNPYVMLRKEMINNRDLSWEARGVLSYLLGKPDDWDVRIEDLQQQCGRDRVYRILNELADAGHIIKPRKHKDAEGKWVWTPYLVYEIPQVEEPHTENPYTDNPKPENTDTLLSNESPSNERGTPTPTAKIFQHYAVLTDNITPYIRDAISDLIDDHGETAVLAAVESAVEASPSNPLRWMEAHLGEATQNDPDEPESAPLVEAYREAVNMVTSYTPTGKDATAFAELHAAGVTPEQLTEFIDAISAEEYWRGKRLPVSVCARDIGAWLKAKSSDTEGQAWTGRALGDRPLGAGIRFANGNNNHTGSNA